MKRNEPATPEAAEPALPEEPWPYDREDHEIEYRYEEWLDK